MNYKDNLTEEQNIAIDKIFPCWTMERDENGFIVIYPNIQDEEARRWTQVNYKDLEKRLEYLSCLLADIEDTSLLEESMELNEEEAKDFLLCRIHNFLYEEFKDTENQLDKGNLVIETWKKLEDPY